MGGQAGDSARPQNECRPGRMEHDGGVFGLWGGSRIEKRGPGKRTEKGSTFSSSKQKTIPFEIQENEGEISNAKGLFQRPAKWGCLGRTPGGGGNSSSKKRGEPRPQDHGDRTPGSFGEIGHSEQKKGTGKKGPQREEKGPSLS